MKFVEVSVSRPVATTLLTAAVALAGIFAFPKLAVSPLPQVDLPTIMVQAQMPGASPEVMATSVTAPLERHLGRIADVTEITSQSSQSNSRIILQFGLDRDINGAVRDVEAAMNAAHADLPAGLRSNPIYRKYNPADAPSLTLALSSDTRTPAPSVVDRTRRRPAPDAVSRLRSVWVSTRKPDQTGLKDRVFGC